MRAGRNTFGLTQASGRWWLVLLVLLAASVYAYRTRDSVAVDVARFGGPAQGTTYSVVLGGPRTAAKIAELETSVDSLLADINAKMSTYDTESEITRFNRARTTDPVAISELLAHVIRASADVSRASGGAFDVTVAPLVGAWGFGPSGDVATAPGPDTLAALRARVGWEQLHLDGQMLRKSHPLLEVDLNAIAPGYTVDRISALLVSRGESDHLVELGGEMRARGHNVEGRPFRVGIEEPIPDTRRVRLAVGLSDRALATSGNYRDFHDMNGVRYTHILDPSTGIPVRHTLLSVSVLHEQCAYADAWATALYVVGPDRAWELAKANALDVLLLLAGPNGEIQERATDGFTAVVLRDSERRSTDPTTRRGQSSNARVP